MVRVELGQVAVKLAKLRNRSLFGLLRGAANILRSWWKHAMRALGPERMLLLFVMALWQRKALVPSFWAALRASRHASLQAADYLSSGTLGRAARWVSDSAGKVLVVLGAGLVVGAQSDFSAIAGPPAAAASPPAPAVVAGQVTVF
jgi:hypothetical protein